MKRKTDYLSSWTENIENLSSLDFFTCIQSQRVLNSNTGLHKCFTQLKPLVTRYMYATYLAKTAHTWLMMQLTNNQPFHKSLYTPHVETYTSAGADQLDWKGCV